MRPMQTVLTMVLVAVVVPVTVAVLVDDVEVLVLVLVLELEMVMLEVELLVELELLVVLELVVVVVHMHSLPNFPLPRTPHPSPEVRHADSFKQIAVGYRAFTCNDPMRTKTVNHAGRQNFSFNGLGDCHPIQRET